MSNGGGGIIFGPSASTRKSPKKSSTLWLVPSSSSPRPLAAIAFALLVVLYGVLSLYSYGVLQQVEKESLSSTTAGGVGVDKQELFLHRHQRQRNKKPVADVPAHHQQQQLQQNSSLSSSSSIRREKKAIKQQHQQQQHQITSSEERHWTKPAYSYSSFDKDVAERALKKFGPDAIRQTLTAYIEKIPLDDVVPNTGSRGDMSNDKDQGTPPQFRVPLPLRTQAKPENLVAQKYPKLRTCHDVPSKIPVDRGIVRDDKTGDVVVWNVGDKPTPHNFPELELPHCPVESDPYLPWIHDVFPSQDGSRIEFIAQNKRRCRTGKKYDKDVNRLVPQVALMQPVSVERISEAKAEMLAPDLWRPYDDLDTDKEDGGKIDSQSFPPRYRLSTFNESSPDGQYTRFICRFYATKFDSDGSSPPRLAVIGETLSEYPFNYEYAAYKKGFDNLLTAKGKDTMYFWASTIRFRCPVPDVGTLRDDVANGRTVLSDGTATIYLDLVPIRTSARYDEVHLTEKEVGPSPDVSLFDAAKRWGPANVVPRVEASGRWSNIPICRPPPFTDDKGETKLIPSIPMNSGRSAEDNDEKEGKGKIEKPHFLSACLWASTEFKTRGRTSGAESDTVLRLKEWLEFHKLVGFDHVYLYDNSGAHTNETSLADVADQYQGFVTRIDWPAVPCNNNIPAHDSTGERSSQYAAENSCRTRFAPFTEWIAVFDTDEYLVPMGKYENLKDVIRDAAKHGTEVLSFRSSRGKLRVDAIIEDDQNGKIEKDANATYLEAYNCDSGGIPKPGWADRARKQIYRADYVMYHFVHYSTVTRAVVQTYEELGPKKFKRGHNLEERKIQRVTDEINEAVMVHTKTILKDMTSNYKKKCHKDYNKKWQGCWVAAPWPDNKVEKGDKSYNAEGMDYNCFINVKVDNYWVPKLMQALKARQQSTSLIAKK